MKTNTKDENKGATYSVTYHANENSTESERNTIEALQGENDLESIIKNCVDLRAEADLYDAPGFRRGWVHADGSYKLT